jgi:hypothetical protein
MIHLEETTRQKVLEILRKVEKSSPFAKKGKNVCCCMECFRRR